MLSISSLVEFIMKLLRDPDTQAEFARDPEGVLARNGLHDLSAQDVCDVAPIVADHAGVSPVSGAHQPFPDHEDAVGALSHIKEHYVVKEVLASEPKHYDLTYVDDRDTIVNVDDRDTVSIQAQGDVTIEDSFNQDNDVNLIEDSFNQDNDGVDNKQGSIEHGAVAGTSDPDPTGVTEPDPADLDLTESDESSVDPAGIDDDDPRDEHQPESELDLAG